MPTVIDVMNNHEPDLYKQSQIQAQVQSIIDELDLDERLQAIGQPVRVGSAALGVMVRRDIDLTVICQALNTECHQAIAGLAADLTLHPQIGAVRFRNDSGHWNKTPQDYPDGLYIGIHFQADDDTNWNLDIWFIDEPDRQPDLSHLRTLLPRLTPANRQTILTIKTQLANADPGLDRPVASYQVYEAVLDHGVCNFGEFLQWLGASVDPTTAAITQAPSI